MGLLSSRTFRQVATGALQGVEDKRNEMRDRIDTYRERAVNKKAEIQKKYNEYYNEEKANIQAFKNVSTQIGENYTGQLNSFVMGGGDINALAQLDSNSIVDKLSTQKVDEGQGQYLDKVSEDIKLKREELNQNLQDQVGLFKGTSSLFTRDIEERGIKDIQATVGEIDAGKPIDTKFSAGKSIEKTSLTNTDIANIMKAFDDLYYKKIPGSDAGGGAGEYEYDMKDPKVMEIFNKAKILQGNAELRGVDINEITARAEILYSQQYDWYKGDNLQYLTPQSKDSIEVKAIVQDFEDNLNAETELSVLQAYIDKVAPLNKFISEALQTKFNEEKAEREGRTTPDDGVTVEDATSTDNIPGTKLESRGKGKIVVTEDYLTDADKDANSKKQVSEEFIKQVMDKNNVDRNRAIEIMQMYGYTQFPSPPKSKAPPFLKGRNK